VVIDSGCFACSPRFVGSANVDYLAVLHAQEKESRSVTLHIRHQYLRYVAREASWPMWCRGQGVFECTIENLQ
jgi:hypothetical protein